MSLPALVPTNHVLTSGANSALTWTNALTVNSVNYSTLAGSTISAARLATSTLQTSTLQTGAAQVSTITTSTIGVGTLTPQYALDVRGSAFVSSLVAPVDPIAQGAYLTPSAANSSIITAWIQKTVANNTPVAGTGPFWSSPATGSAFGTIAGAPGGYAYGGGVLLPDGRVVFVPYNATTIGLFNPVTNAYTTVAGAPGNYAYLGGVLLPDGRVVFVPHNATTIGLYLGNTPAPKNFCLHPCFNKL